MIFDALGRLALGEIPSTTGGTITTATTVVFTIEFHNGSAWVDMTNDVRGAFSFQRGIGGSGAFDRIARTGSLQFALDNSTNNYAATLGYYSPGKVGAVAGFDIGTPVRLRFASGNLSAYKFKGRISRIEPESGLYRGRAVSVTVLDYMDILASRKISLLDVQTSKTSDQLISTVLGQLEIQPDTIALSTGVDTFAYALDTERDERTTALSALTKVMQSDLGYLYVAAGTASAEILTYETRQDRLGDAVAATFDNSMVNLAAARDMALLGNVVKVTTYPRKIDAAATTVLARLQREIIVPAGGTVTQTFRYVDPDGGGARVSGIDMVTPQATTDYTMFSATGGGGSDITVDLTVNADFGGNSAEVEFVNGNAGAGYINFFQLRGKGVYLYDPVDAIEQDTTSITAYGDRELSYSMPYQDDPLVGTDIATELLRRYKNPYTDISALEYYANRSAVFSEYALLVDIGSLITVREQVTGVTNDYYVNGVQGDYDGGALYITYILEKPFVGGDVFILDSLTNGVLDTNYLGA